MITSEYFINEQNEHKPLYFGDNELDNIVYIPVSIEGAFNEKYTLLDGVNVIDSTYIHKQDNLYTIAINVDQLNKGFNELTLAYNDNIYTLHLVYRPGKIKISPYIPYNIKGLMVKKFNFGKDRVDFNGQKEFYFRIENLAAGYKIIYNNEPLNKNEHKLRNNLVIIKNNKYKPEDNFYVVFYNKSQNEYNESIFSKEDSDKYEIKLKYKNLGKFGIKVKLNGVSLREKYDYLYDPKTNAITFKGLIYKYDFIELTYKTKETIDVDERKVFINISGDDSNYVGRYKINVNTGSKLLKTFYYNFSKINKNIVFKLDREILYRDLSVDIEYIGKYTIGDKKYSVKQEFKNIDTIII